MWWGSPSQKAAGGASINASLDSPRQVGDLDKVRGSPLSEVGNMESLASVQRVPSSPVAPMCAVEGQSDQLRATLAQREAALLRQEGENFLLGAQVRQLELQAQEAGQSAQLCAAQLAQAQQLLDSNLSFARGGTIQHGRGEVDRAKALLAGARRSLGRLAVSGPSTRRVERSAAVASSGAASSSVAAASDAAHTHRRPSPRRGPQNPQAHQNTELIASHSSAAALHVSPKECEARPQNRRPQAGAATRAKSGGVAHDRGEQRARRSPTRSGPAVQRPIGGELAVVASPEQLAAPQKPECKYEAVACNAEVGPTQAPAEMEGFVSKEQFQRQRELLMRALRKCSSMEADVAALRDDVTRRDVVIHNLRQEVQTQRQEIEVLQQQQAEQQQQQTLQQQHHLQQLQQLQQLQELQTLVQQQQLLEQQRHADVHIFPGLSGSLPVPGPTQIPTWGQVTSEGKQQSDSDLVAPSHEFEEPTQDEELSQTQAN